MEHCCIPVHVCTCKCVVVYILLTANLLNAVHLPYYWLLKMVCIAITVNCYIHVLSSTKKTFFILHLPYCWQLKILPCCRMLTHIIINRLTLKNKHIPPFLDIAKGLFLSWKYAHLHVLLHVVTSNRTVLEKQDYERGWTNEGRHYLHKQTREDVYICSAKIFVCKVGVFFSVKQLNSFTPHFDETL